MRWPDGTLVKYIRWNNMLNGMPPAGAGFSQDMKAHMAQWRSGLHATLQDDYIYVWFGEFGEYLRVAAIVDDLLAGCRGSYRETAQSILQSFKKHMEGRWGIKDLPVDGFLNNQVSTSRDGKRMTIRMTRRIVEMAQEYIPDIITLSDYKWPENPCSTELRLIGKDDDERLHEAEAKMAHTICAKLIYIVSMVFYSCQYAVFYTARYTSSPTRRYKKSLLHIVEYMYANRNVGLTLGGTTVKLLVGSTTDAGHAEEGPSTGGHTIEVDGHTIQANSGQHRAITLTSALAEQYELSRAVANVIDARDLCTEIGVPQLEPSQVFSDSSSAVRTSGSAQSDKQSLYMKRRIRFVQWATQDEKVDVQHVSGEANHADTLTKHQTNRVFHMTEPVLMRRGDAVDIEHVD